MSEAWDWNDLRMGLLYGELGRIESVRYIKTPQFVASKLGFKQPTYGKAQWKSEVNRHLLHK